MMSKSIAKSIEWIAVDWGTSRLRAFAMGADNRPLAETSSDQGMGTLSRDEFEPALSNLISEWLQDGPKPLLACGMVGARQGWVEAAYRSVPGPALSLDGFVRAPAKDPKYALRILPGMCQAQPADVMRGEETQITGFLAANPAFNGRLCLPGTHSKWATLADGEVKAFTTYMTGETFALLSASSVLRHSVAAIGEMSGKPGQDFFDGLDRAHDTQGNLSADLFSIRAKSLLQDFSPTQAFDYLSGLVLGSELVAALAGNHDEIALVAAGLLGDRYTQALSHFGVKAITLATTDATLAGLAAAYKTMKEAGEWAEIS